MPLFPRPLCVFLPLALCALMACEQPNWEDPAYVTTQLQSEDPAARRVALERVGAMPEEKQRELGGELTKLYLKKDSNQKEVMTKLVQWRLPGAKDAYIEEVKTDATQMGGAAAEALGEIKAKDAIPSMVALLEKTDNPQVKQGILRGFKLMPDKQMVEPLVKILKLDADNHPLALHKYACETLGELAQVQPDALDAEAKKTLVYGVFLANTMRQDVAKECGLAVQQLGASAIPALLEVYAQKNPQIQQLMMAYKFPQNRPKGVATARLVSLRAPEAKTLFLESLQANHEVPETEATNAEKKAAWLQNEVQMLSEQILGLGDLGVTDAVPELVRVLKGERNKDWSHFMLDPAVQTQLRQDAAQALNQIGQREAAGELLGMVTALDANKEMEKIAAHFESKNQPMNALERYSFNLMTARALANLAPGSMKPEFEKALGEIKDEALVAEMKKFLPAFDLQAECSAKGEPKAQADCYLQKIQDADPILSQKAAYELGRLPTEVASPALAKALKVPSLPTREVVASNLYRHPSKEAVGTVNELMAKEASRSGAPAALDRYRLSLLRAWLMNNTE